MTPQECTSYGRNPGGSIMWRVQILRLIAKALRIQFKIGGMPYGASYERAVNRAWERTNLRRHAETKGEAL